MAGCSNESFRNPLAADRITAAHSHGVPPVRTSRQQPNQQRPFVTTFGDPARRARPAGVDLLSPGAPADVVTCATVTGIAATARAGRVAFVSILFLVIDQSGCSPSSPSESRRASSGARGTPSLHDPA